MTTPLQTFTTSPYNLEYFKDFIQEAFPQAQLLNSPTESYKDGHIIHAYTPICQDIELESSNILQVFAFEVGSTHAKITLHKELAKIAKNNASHILACFYNPRDPKEFRLSLITTGFDFEANKTTHSNLRRQSFVLGDSIPTHTAQKQLQTLIDSQAKSKQALEEAFSLQAVTDEFYAEYKKLYDDLCQTLNAHQAAINALNGYQGLSGEKATSAFVKKLLGRIIFLYFLQKKGWLGIEQGKQWGSGDKHFFRSLFTRAKAQGQSFYTKFLCPLFFESLNTERKDDYSQELGCKIPFLNGGLFEEAKLPATQNHSFDRHIAIEQALDNTQFAKIFELFDRYHFTIEESTPDNVEISIDPEMLGKVFENLIDYNKDTGAFYTKREIVHYMCKGALSSYLLSKIDSSSISQATQAIQALIINHDSSLLPESQKPQILALLQECTILDNAIGSGAFPMGLLLEILEAIRALCPELSQADLAAHKRQIIANQIYGVDIDGDAIEIAKLRFWLSIAVDEPSPSPLPNLDFKFMQGNSLLESICSIPVLPKLASHLEQPKTLMDTNEQLKRDYGSKPSERTLLDTTTAQQLEAIFLSYYESHTPSTKLQLKQDILRLLRQATDKEIAYKQDQIDKLLKNATPKTLPKAQAKAQKLALELADFQAKLNDLLHAYEHNDFHSPELFLYRFFFAPVFAKGGFDIVIGNPPYIRQENIPQKTLIEKEFSAYKLYTDSKPFKFSSGTADIYTYFYAKGLELLKPNGILSFITSNKYCRAGYGENLRTTLLESTILDYVELNGIKAFDNATVDTSIITIAKTPPTSTHALSYKPPRESSILPTLNGKPIAIAQCALSQESFIFPQSELELALKAKIEAIGTPLKEWDISIYRGILTGYNEAFIIDSNKRDEILRNCVSENERQRTSELIKPILRGRDIKRYSYEWAGLWIINTHNGYTTSDSSLTQSLQELQQNASVITAKVTPSHFASQPTNLTQDTRIAKDIESSHCETSAGSRGNPQTTKIKIPPIDINDYPALKAHLDTHWDKIAKRADKGETPYNLRNCAYLEEFEKEKIVWNPVSGEYFFTHIKETMYFNNSLFMMTDSADNAISPSLRGSGDSHNEAIHKDKAQKVDSSMDCHEVVPTSRNDKLLYILGLMNSTLYKWLITQMTNLVETGKYAYGAKDKIEKLPIPKVDSKTEAEFIQIVQEILESKKQGRDTKELESTLDTMVCKLYNLSQAEADSVLSLSLLVALLLVAALQSKARNLANFVLDNFEKELCEAFRFCPNLKLPTKCYQSKIIYPNMASEFIAYLDRQGFFTNQKCFILTEKNADKDRLLYLTAVLNSKCNFWYFRQIGATLGASGYEMSKIFVERLPIPQEVNPTLLAELESLAAQILESKQMDRHAENNTRNDTQELESRLDSLIYQLYGLNDREIALIESSFTERERERETCDS